MPTRAEPSRWAVLALLGVAQLMVVLDVTIVNIALPSAQNSLLVGTDEPPRASGGSVSNRFQVDQVQSVDIESASEEGLGSVLAVA